MLVKKRKPKGKVLVPKRDALIVSGADNKEALTTLSSLNVSVMCSTSSPAARVWNIVS